MKLLFWWWYKLSASKRCGYRATKTGVLQKRLIEGIYDPINLTLVRKASEGRTLVHVPYLNYIEARRFSYHCHAREWSQDSLQSAGTIFS